MSLIPRDLLTFPLPKRSPRDAAKAAKKAKPKPMRARNPKAAALKREGMSRGYRESVRRLPCCTCGMCPPSDPHHLKNGTGERGMGLKSTDKWLVPLCRECHDDVERAGSTNEPGWFRAHGVDALVLARRLWDAWRLTNCEVKMRRIVALHQAGDLPQEPSGGRP
ncbi:MAG: hypothetical protein NW215_10545 [Hyphomicrobiales bacterium]|nr:hypothetical protein [Hyphomicrobiales bacterium]